MTHVLSKTFFGIAAAMCVVIAASAWIRADTPPSNPEETVMSACSACHDTGKVCKALGSRNLEAWTKTVQRMVGKGAKVPSGDIPAVSSYLAGLKRGSRPVCK